MGGEWSDQRLGRVDGENQSTKRGSSGSELRRKSSQREEGQRGENNHVSRGTRRGMEISVEISAFPLAAGLRRRAMPHAHEEEARLWMVHDAQTLWDSPSST